jgi:hypothetical protein
LEINNRRRMMGVINPPPGEGPAGVPEPSYKPIKSAETSAIEAVRDKLLGQVSLTSEYTKPGGILGPQKLSGDGLIKEIEQIKDPSSLGKFIKKCERWEGADGFADIVETAIAGENQVKNAGIAVSVQSKCPLSVQ